MAISGSRWGGRKPALPVQRRVLTTVGAAVCIALYGAAHPVRADDAGPATVAGPSAQAALAAAPADDSSAQPTTLQEITVTANRRNKQRRRCPTA